MGSDNLYERKDAVRRPSAGVNVGLFTGGQDRPYAFGLAMALASTGVSLEIIGSDEVDSPEFHNSSALKFLNFRGSQQRDSKAALKVTRLVKYYGRLLHYAIAAKPKVFHILWNNKFELFDRTLLMLYYKACRRKVVLTAHNVNAAQRNASDTWLNRLTLKIQYALSDHIFVHTNRMKRELVTDFGVCDEAITILTHPINNAFPDTRMTTADARRRLNLESSDKVMLFFGRIQPYKGLEYLVEAFHRIAPSDLKYKLIIAGEPKKGSEQYMREIQLTFRSGPSHDRVLWRLEFIPDEDAEIYLKASDVLVLPYKDIFQSGVLFLSFTFGLPVVATDVGSFCEDIEEGRTGFLSKRNDPADLARALEDYFRSDLFKNLPKRREEIKADTRERHSWVPVAEATRQVYANLLRRHST